MAHRTNPFASSDWFEEFPTLAIITSRGEASTNSSTYGNYDSSSDDSSGYAPSSDDSSSDVFSITDFSITDFSINDLSINDLSINDFSSSDDFSSDTETTNSIADSDATDSSVDLLFAVEGQVIDTAPLLGGYPFPPVLPHEFLSLFIGSDDESVLAAQSVDMREELGIIIILPPGFFLPGMDIQPYDATHSPEQDFSFSMAFTPNGRITRELADAAFAIEVRDPDRFLGSIGDDGRYESARHLLEELYVWLYGSYDFDGEGHLL